MAIAHTPRACVPTDVKAGAIVEIKTLISHEMETGRRIDSEGKSVPRKIIIASSPHSTARRCSGRLGIPSISANLYQSFFLKAIESSLLEFTWKDDDGTEYRSSAH